MEAIRSNRKSKRIPRRKRRTPKNYFKFPIGVTSGTIHFTFSPCESLCACLVAYCFSFLKSEHSWTVQFINELLLSVAEDLTVDVDLDGDLSSFSTSFLLYSYTLDVWMSEIAAGALNHETENLFENLKGCLSTRRAVLIISGEECVAIWTRDDHFGYFVFIPSRKSLFLVATLKDLVTSFKFISNLATSYRICEMEVTKLIEGTSPQVLEKLPSRGFVVVDEDLAILRGTLQLKLPQEGSRDFQGLHAAHTAAMFAYRTPLASWDSDILDRVLMLSESVTSKTLKGGKTKYTSILSCGPSRVHLDTEVAFYADFGEVLEDLHRLEKVLGHGWSLIVEISGIYWTIMQQKIFYLFNPYVNSREKSFGSSLQMHQNLRNVFEIMGRTVDLSAKATVRKIKIISMEETGPTTPNDQNNSEEVGSSSEGVSHPRTPRSIKQEAQEAEETLEIWDKKDQQPRKSLGGENSSPSVIQEHTESSLATPEQAEEKQNVKNEKNMKELLEEMKKKRREIQMKLKKNGPSGDHRESVSTSLSEEQISEQSSTFVSSAASTMLNTPQNTPLFLDELGSSDGSSYIESETHGGLQEITVKVESLHDVEDSEEEITSCSESTIVESDQEAQESGKPYEIKPEVEKIKPSVKKLKKPIKFPAKREVKSSTFRITADASRDSSPATAKDDLIVLQSNTGSRVSLHKLIRKGLTLSSRLLITTPWKRFVVLHKSQQLFVYRRCICNVHNYPKKVTDCHQFWCFDTIQELISHIQETKIHFVGN